MSDDNETSDAKAEAVRAESFRIGYEFAGGKGQFLTPSGVQYTVLPCQSCGHEQHLALMQIAGRFGVYVVVGEGMTLVGQLGGA